MALMYTEVQSVEAKFELSLYKLEQFIRKDSTWIFSMLTVATILTEDFISSHIFFLKQMLATVVLMVKKILKESWAM
jgi:hypothetical protein